MSETVQSPSAAAIRSPREVDIEITSRCNLRCGYCYYYGNPSIEYRDLPAAEWLAFFNELGRQTVMRVTLMGGEPFIRADLPLLLDGIVRNRMRFSILTNGTLVDDAAAAAVARTRRCDMVQVSIDGATPEVHDAMRGAHSFEGAVRGVRMLQRHAVPVGVRVTITRHNVATLEAMARFLLEELGLPGFSTNAAGYLGTCRRNAAGMMLSTEDRSLAMETLQRLSLRYPGRITGNAGPVAEARVWRDMRLAAAGRAAPFSQGGRLTGCGCPHSKMAVRADGAMIPCVMLAHLELGRIGRDDLGAVWRESPVLEQLRRRSAIPLSSFDHCRGCAYAPYCTGNCPGLAYAVTGVVDHPSPDACLRAFERAGGRLPGPDDRPHEQHT